MERPVGLLNAAERHLMNNPFRAALQRQFEARMLLRLGGAVPGARVLEVGCGRGVGVEILLDRFGASRVDAFDLDPGMVERARRRLAGRGEAVRLWVGSVTSIDAPDEHYDAVFDFGILHHVPDWRGALREIARVLAPGGRLYAEEMLEGFLRRPLVMRTLDHPAAARFDASAFAEGIEQTGLRLVGQTRWLDAVAWFVAHKPAAEDA